MEQIKKLTPELIKYYYDDLNNNTGGFLHIVLHDGNTDHANIYACRKDCEDNKDTFGMFLCDVLMCFTEIELDKMYNSNWTKCPT